MAYPTQPAFIHHGAWNQTSRSVPPIEWMENFINNAIDSGSYKEPNSSGNDYYTDDVTYFKSDGSIVTGAKCVWDAAGESYAPFSSHQHQPEMVVSWRTEDGGYAAMGWASFFYNLHGPCADTVKDASGRTWHGVAPAAVYFEFARQKLGLRLKTIRQFADPTPAVRLMLKNQQMGVEHLAESVLNGSLS